MLNSRAGALLLCLLLATDSSFAQIAPDTGQLMREQERLRRPPPVRTLAAPVLYEPSPPAPAVADGGPRLLVKGFRFSQNSVFDSPTLGALLSDLIGRELSLAELNEAADRITAHYRQQGYFLANAYLPAQDIADGMLDITVLEGRLGQVRLDNQSRVKDSVLRAHLDDLPAGQALAGAALERKLLLINSLAGVSVQSTLTPGTSVGSTDLDIRAEGLPPVSASLGLDNFGTRYSGIWRANAALGLSNPLGLGDALSLNAYSAGRPYSYGRLAYQLPVGQQGMQLGLAGSAMNYRLGGDFAELLSHGRAEVASVYALQTLQRSRSSKLQLQLNFDHKSLQDRIDSVQSHSDKKIDVLLLGLSGDQLDAAGRGSLRWSFGHVQGRLKIDPVVAAAAAKGPQSAGRYAKWTGTLTRQQSLGVLGQALDPWLRPAPKTSFEPATVAPSEPAAPTPSGSAIAQSLSITAQIGGQFSAGKNLDSSEKFSLGGAQGVRAYPQGEAACDDAWLLNLELRLDLSPAWQLSALFDAGAGRLSHNPIQNSSRNQARLSGLGFGANFSGPSGLSWITSLAWRTGPAPLSDQDRSPRLWTSAQQTF
ncbi:ShlB/FhaC/HecB family hemolysin secretion/activation protein [Paucibacter sp. TC2R-5]|uniref:ShlB/FhaC/HecB family hemolysin secretion/activation protein n=1 Tax=Paucibacter sp. TC2R-5 TaxID=2893555 RepID=UPI0021E35991|nr:ShlB/FhaC/HecB family hemolysin secretion/activation protein [Paucibacter sp. TC2R-5]MCV2359151.1 ShlB/FhaC/HecB family hemolysin secretion/activation protein [Paucibacter sp. TC2R-5]